ncbi:MAG: hypothetical protein V5A37_05620 [Halobacteriales archaeon]
MTGGDQQLHETVRELVEYWIPGEGLDEAAVTGALQRYLDRRLAEVNGDAPMGMNRGGSHAHVVSREYGDRYADLVVDDAVGVVVRCGLTAGRATRLRHRLRDHVEAYPSVVVCVCGIEAADGWRRLRDAFDDEQGVGLWLPDGGRIAFVPKRRPRTGRPLDNRRASHRRYGAFGG